MTRSAKWATRGELALWQGQCTQQGRQRQTDYLANPSSSGVERPSSSMVGLSCETMPWYTAASCALSLMPSKMRTVLQCRSAE